MNTLKSIALGLASLSNIAHGMFNFSMINPKPDKPIYYKINNEQSWHQLDKTQPYIKLHIPLDV